MEQRNREQTALLRLVMAALLAAMTCVATMVLVVPSPTGGYMNLGDAVVLLGVFLLGPVYGAAAGIPSNLVQAVFGIAAGALLTAALRNTKAAGRLFSDGLR